MDFVFRAFDGPANFLKEEADQLVFVVEEGVRSPVVSALDAEHCGSVSRAIKEEQFQGKPSQSLTLLFPGPKGNVRMTLLGVGLCPSPTVSDIRTWAARAVRSASPNVRRIVLWVGCAVAASTGQPTGQPTGQATGARSTGQAQMLGQAVAEGVLLATYQFDKYLSKDRKTTSALSEFVVCLPASADLVAVQSGAERGKIVAQGVCLARDLTNESPKEKTPPKLAQITKELAARFGLGCKVFDAAQCEEMGMGMLLAVGQGSSAPPCLIHLSYRPKETANNPALRRKVALIGKAVTFDSGGLSLKNTESMLHMKTDMGGAAAVIGAMSVIAQLGCPHEVHAIFAAAENMPSGNSYRLGDVLRSMSGKTVEINNTDAEGRLTLGDALTYAITNVSPDEIIDIATLTGGAQIALGNHTGALFANEDGLAARLLRASAHSGDDVWRMPLRDRLFETLKSDVADMKNSSDRHGSAIAAALFLREFVGSKPWAHLDMAGPVRAEKESGHIGKGATGFGTALLVSLLCDT